jgi:hypothetical protein
MTGQHFEPDLRNSAVRDYRGGPRETWLWWNCEPTLQTERARMETLYLLPARPRSIPICGSKRTLVNLTRARHRAGEHACPTD